MNISVDVAFCGKIWDVGQSEEVGAAGVRGGIKGRVRVKPKERDRNRENMDGEMCAQRKPYVPPKTGCVFYVCVCLPCPAGSNSSDSR